MLVYYSLARKLNYRSKIKDWGKVKVGKITKLTRFNIKSLTALWLDLGPMPVV